MTEPRCCLRRPRRGHWLTRQAEGSIDGTDAIDLAATANGVHVIGIGASGGGLAAFEQFFSHMPSDLASDVAIVLVQHLDPHHKSLLVELIARYAKMPVFEAEDGAVVVRGQF